MTCIQIGLAATGAYAHSTPEPGFATAKTNVERMNITNSKVNNAEAPYRRVTFQARTAKFNTYIDFNTPNWPLRAALEAHLDWSNREPTPFISVASRYFDRAKR